MPEIEPQVVSEFRKNESECTLAENGSVAFGKRLVQSDDMLPYFARRLCTNGGDRSVVVHFCRRVSAYGNILDFAICTKNGRGMVMVEAEYAETPQAWIQGLTGTESKASHRSHATHLRLCMFVSQLPVYQFKDAGSHDRSDQVVKASGSCFRLMSSLLAGNELRRCLQCFQPSRPSQLLETNKDMNLSWASL